MHVFFKQKKQILLENLCFNRYNILKQHENQNQ